VKSELEIRKGRASDLAAVMALDREIPNGPHWTEMQWLDMLREETISHVQRWVFVAEGSNGSLAGSVVVGFVAGTAELEWIAVSAVARRCGLGRALCARAVDWAVTQGATEVHLELRASNVAAMALYRSAGFVEQGKRKHYYSDPVEDAALMTLALARQAKAAPQV